MKEQRRRKKKGGYFPTTARPLLRANVARRSSRLERTLPCRESDACWDMLENDDCCLATLRDMWKSEVHCWRTRGRACYVQDHLKIEQKTPLQMHNHPVCLRSTKKEYDTFNRTLSLVHFPPCVSQNIIIIVTDCITFDPPFHCDKMALQVLHFFKIWIFFVANI